MQKTDSWGTIILLLLVISQVNSSTYYISNECEPIATDSCLTLSEVATAISDGSDSNISLIINAGSHKIFANLTLQSLDYFSMTSGNDFLTVIMCGDSAHFQLVSVSYVHIQGITFKECFKSEMISIDKFIIENSAMYTYTCTVKTNNSHALIITKSTGTIMTTYFEGCSSTKPFNMGAIKLMNSKLLIKTSTFTGYRTLKGGAISCSESIIMISSSELAENCGKHHGGAIYSINSRVFIRNSTFTRNSAKKGGALYIQHNRNKPITPQIICSWMLHYWIHSQWNYNNASKTICIEDFTLYIIASTFTSNFATKKGGVFIIKNSPHVLIHNSSFENSKARRESGVGMFTNSTIQIKNSVFCNNNAGINSGGLYFSDFTNVTIESSEFYNNTAQNIGGSLYIKGNSIKSNVTLTGLTNFSHNSARVGSILYLIESAINFNGSHIMSNNNGTILASHSIVRFIGRVLFLKNIGSMYLFDSYVYLSGFLNCTKHTHSIKKEANFSLEGGGLTFFLSTLNILRSGRVLLNENTATNGGGILSITSRIIIDINCTLNVTNNNVSDTGGGIYLYHSDMYVRGIVHIAGNSADKVGGGIHCISSTIVIIILNKNSYSPNSHIQLVKNSAHNGSGVFLEASSKFYIKQVHESSRNIVAVEFIENKAIQSGGAIFIADNTTSGTCANDNLQSVTSALQSQCFIQIVAPITVKHRLHIGNVFNFINNTAMTPSAKLYGGLLDRCTVNAYGKATRYSSIPNSFDSILNDTTSDPVRVCLCNPNSATVNCSQTPNTQYYRKGSNFTLTVAAVDQVNRILPATIHGSLKSQRGHLGDGQQAQQINDTCTNLSYSIFSPLNYDVTDYLYLYAEGPCKYYGISSLQIIINFIPCTCPIGFETAPKIKDRCACTCHSKLKNIFSFIRNSDCNYETLTLQRNKDFWITATNLTSMTFVSYKHCPSAYCRPSLPPVHIDFSTPNEADIQCAFNHTGVLCGKCKANLTLSLGSSRCIECPQLWPLITLSISIGFCVTGLAMVAMILTLNLTVATGTLNAMIFYANVIATNQQHLLAFEHPNFHSVVVSWLNLDSGFDACFFKGLNAYSKAWLQLAFPVYIILIVVTVIVVSQYSRKFATLIARKNPVATLATLILFSYAKLLHSIIGILSFAKLLYTPIDNNMPFTKLVWLYDGSIAYLQGKHIPLFILAVLIMIVGLLFTFLLLCWQNLVKLSHKWAFLWVRNTKLSSFIDAYHAPYNARNRYWTGLLLLARIILYFTAGVNVNDDPSVNLLSILLVIGCILLLHAYSGMAIYKKWTLNIFEFTTYINILTFIAVKFYIELAGGSHSMPAYISISIQVAVLICSIIHHIVQEFRLVDKIRNSKWCTKRSNYDLQARLLPGHQLEDEHTPQNVTFSEVTIDKRDALLTTGRPDADSDARDELTSLFDIDNTRL